MRNRCPPPAMPPSIRLKLSAELQAIITRWAHDASPARPQPALRIIKGGRP